MAQHLRDHLLNFYLKQAHEAVDKAQREELIEEDANAQAALIVKVQRIIEQQLNGFAQELAQIDQAAQQFAPKPPPMPQDNSMQIAQLGAQTQVQIAAQRTQVDQAKLAQQVQLEQAKLADKAQDREVKAALDAQRQQAETIRLAAELKSREDMNNADNATALQISAAEIATGERSNLTTGTGINP